MFKFDALLSHSSKDKPVVTALAERLQANGIRVWFDAWQIQLGDCIPAKIDEGLENSYALLFCMSKNAFGSDWTALESNTFRFRDPQNKARRLIPIRLDDAPIKSSFEQFRYVDWKPECFDVSYPQILRVRLKSHEN